MNNGNITDINLGIDVTDPEHKGNNKLMKIKAFKLNFSFLRNQIAKMIIRIV